jgi:creatinine amidohydrolase
MSANQNSKPTGVYLETLSWPEAEAVLGEKSVVVIPLGASAKEHGPHLPLNNDALIANWLAAEVCRRLPVVVAPLINASFYPAFVEYPGSISLRVQTACDFLVDTCRSLAAFGVAKFYVLNTGVSTERPLAMARTELESDNVRLTYLKFAEAFSASDSNPFKQQYGSHADEHETSLMLHIAPDVVDMNKAVDDGAEGEGRLSRRRGKGIWSASGVYGQATLASAEKGELVADALVETAIREIQLLMKEYYVQRAQKNQIDAWLGNLTNPGIKCRGWILLSQQTNIRLEFWLVKT